MVDLTLEEIKLLVMVIKQQPAQVSRDFHKEDLEEAILDKLRVSQEIQEERLLAIKEARNPDWSDRSGWKHYVTQHDVDRWSTLDQETQFAIYRYCTRFVGRDE